MRQMNEEGDRMKWGRGATFVAVALAAGLCGCAAHRQGMGFGGTRPSLADFMVQLEPQGWTAFDAVREFTAENLYEQINGRAELYLSYDVESMSYLAFEKTDSPGSFLDISVYDMGTATNAFGVFSVERSPDEPEVALGRAAYTSDANVYLWQGRYYIRIIAPEATEALSQTTLGFARKLATFLPETDEEVWGLEALPKEDRVAGTVRYFSVDAMGLGFLRDTYTAEYCFDDEPVTVFLTRADSADAARALAGQYFDYASKYGSDATRVDDGTVVCIFGRVCDVVFTKGRLFAGVTAAPERTRAIRAARMFRERIDDEP